MHLGELIFGAVLASGSVAGLAGVFHFGSFARKTKPKLISAAARRADEIIERIDKLRRATPDAPPRRRLAELRQELARAGAGELDGAFSAAVSFSAASVNDAVATHISLYGKGLALLGFFAAFSTVIGLAGTITGVMTIFSTLSSDKPDVFGVIGGIGTCLRLTGIAMVVALISGAALRIARHTLSDLQTRVRRLVFSVHDAVIDAWPRQGPPLGPAAALPLSRPDTPAARALPAPPSTPAVAP